MKNRTELTKSLHTISVVKALATYRATTLAIPTSAVGYVHDALAILGLTSQASGATFEDCVKAVSKALAKMQAS